MKSNKTTLRSLRVENLENREMLSVTPFDAAPAMETVAVESAMIVDAPIALADVEAEATNQATFTATETANYYTMAWDAIDGAAGYVVKVSRDGGETWITYGKTTDTEYLVKNLKAGTETSYRIYGLNESGKQFGSPMEATFAPVGISASADSYKVGDTIEVTIIGAESATAVVTWEATINGEQIALNTTGTTLVVDETLSAATSITATATGTGLSDGSEASVTLAASNDVIVSYNQDAHTADLTWSAIDGAETYLVKISKDGGETWITYRKGLTDTTTTAAGIYAGKSYEFTVYGYDANGRRLARQEDVVVAPVNATSTVRTYVVGDTIATTIIGAENASSTAQWFAYVGGEWSAIEGATESSLTITEDLAAATAVKFVLTGTGDSAGSSKELTFSRQCEIEYDFDEATNQLTLTWGEIEGAASYRVRISRDGGETWITYRNNVTETTAVALGVYAGKSYQFSIVGVNAEGRTLENSEVSVFAPFKLAMNSRIIRDNFTLRPKFVGAENATATFQWSMLKDGEWTEIEGATSKDLLVSGELASADALKLVATGYGDSVTCDAELVVRAVEPLDVAYDAATETATATWGGQEDAVSYDVAISTDNGETWITVATGVTDTQAAVENVVPGATYEIMATGYNEQGRTVGVSLGAIAPVSVTLSADGFLVGDTLTATVNGSEDAAADLQWYAQVGDVWTAIEGATDASFTVTADLAAATGIKVVATGTGLSEGATAEASVGVRLPETPSAVVTTTEDIVDMYDNLISLREALAYAKYLKVNTITFDAEVFTEENHTITLAPNTNTYNTYAGVYTNLNNGGRFYLTSNMTIDASNLDCYVTLDGSEANQTVVYAMGTASTKIDVTLKNLEIENVSLTTSGAAVYGYYTNLTVDGCSIHDNTVTGQASTANVSASAIMASYSVLTLTNSTISNNTVVEGNAGAVVIASSANSLVDGCVFENNSVSNSKTLEAYAAKGGAIALTGATGTASVTVQNSTFTGNSATSVGSWGGAIGAYNNGALETAVVNLTIDNCDFDGNTQAVGSYSGRTNYRCISNTTIANSTFANDAASAVYSGGQSNAGSTFAVDGCDFVDNAVAIDGQAKYYDIVVAGSTFSGNAVDTQGRVVEAAADSVLDEAFADYLDDLL